MKKTLVFDTETTDLVNNSIISEKHQPHIIEFYGCIVDEGGSVIDELEFLCDPGIPITDEITRITSIKNADVEGKPKFEFYAEQVRDFIKRSDSVAAHNLKFDMSMVDIELGRLGQAAIWPRVQICTVEETEWFLGYRLNLSALHEHLFGVRFDGAHRAKVDVQALTRCFNELRKRGDL
jgi:DNA polymerase III epsilon subunit-like protein